MDISAVAYDWLATGKPLLVTDPAEPRTRLPESGLVRELPLLDAADAGRAPESWMPRCGTPTTPHAALVRRYFGDTTPGASMQRFLDACSTSSRSATRPSWPGVRSPGPDVGAGG